MKISVAKNVPGLPPRSRRARWRRVTDYSLAPMPPMPGESGLNIAETVPWRSFAEIEGYHFFPALDNNNYYGVHCVHAAACE